MYADLITPRESPPLGQRLPRALLARFDRPGPRYTSYPTADRFTEGFDEGLVTATWAVSPGDRPLPLSIYVHIPFCESVCHYCACNRIVTRHHDRAARYLAALAVEAGHIRAAMGRARQVSQLHLGGGTPTFLDDEELRALVAHLHTTFGFSDEIEMSIEIDPRTVSVERLAVLRAMGFGRISFGLQDFDPAVQAAAHRIQPFAAVQTLMHAARALRFDSINADLIYGLPLQTRASFARTVASTIALRPDRIALYAYAHLPTRFKPQRRISAQDLPDVVARVDLLEQAISAFIDAGYEYIGMDHFALPTDVLARARREGRLQRDYQGYGTRPPGDLLALGISAISHLGSIFHQNVKDLDPYYEAIERHALPVDRGIVLSEDDTVHGAAIMALMCQGVLDFDAFGRTHAIDTCRYFARELPSLAPMVDAQLVELGDTALRVTRNGWFVVRAIAMTFDRHLQPARDVHHHSRMVR